MIPFVNQLKTLILKIENPVGHIRFETTDTNPATYLGFGTWTLWGAGRVPVGVDTSQTEFETVEKTGGSKEVTLDLNKIPRHSHTVSIMQEQSNLSEYTAPGWSFAIRESARIWNGAEGRTFNGGSATFGTANATGNGEAHDNLQPYITCYMWKRIA